MPHSCTNHAQRIGKKQRQEVGLPKDGLYLQLQSGIQIQSRKFFGLVPSA
jgi:hypothetical protein